MGEFERNGKRSDHIGTGRPEYLESSFRVWIDVPSPLCECVSNWNVYSDVYSLCVAYPTPFADKLYKETKQFLENHVQNYLATQVAPPGRIDDDEDGADGDDNEVTGSLLQRYYTAWNEYSKGISYLNYLYQ